MKYLCLVYLDEKTFYALPEAEREGLFAQGEALALELQDHPAYLGADGLQPTWTAATVRRRGSNVSVTDGPFAETKEQLAGFLLVDAANLDQAIALATRIPAAHHGSIEIRPVRNLHDSL